MSLSPEFMSFLGRPPAAPNPAAQFVPGYAGKKWEQANQHTEKKDMPENRLHRFGPATDLYDRIIAAINEAGKPLHCRDLVAKLEIPPATAAAGLKKMMAKKLLVQHGKSRNTAYSVAPMPAAVKREAPKVGTKKPKNGAVPLFGVFEDGSVQISTSGCRGKLTPEEASRFLAFIQRIQG